MLDRLAGNDALKADLKQALAANRLAHSILLVGEKGCGTGFAARCLAADYLYPNGGPHAEGVLRSEDSECITVRGEGASGQIPIARIRKVREEIQHSALSEDATGRVLFIYDAQNLNGASANAMLKTMEEPPEGALFLLTAASAATVMPTIRSRCAAYTVTPCTQAVCAAALREALPTLPEQKAAELAFLYEGHIGTCLRAVQDEKAATLRKTAAEIAAFAERQDTYKVAAILAGFERKRDDATALFRELCQLGSAVMRRPGFGGLMLDSARAAAMVRAADTARVNLGRNGNLRIIMTVLAMDLCA